MESVVGVMGGWGSSSTCSSWIQLKGSNKNNDQRMKNGGGFRICCVSSSAVTDPYKTLRIQPGASKSEVKKAFRQLALQYHPDVCRESNSGIQFHQINEAYDIVMSSLRGKSSTSEMGMYETCNAGPRVDESLRWMNDVDWEM